MPWAGSFMAFQAVFAELAKVELIVIICKELLPKKGSLKKVEIDKNEGIDDTEKQPLKALVGTVVKETVAHFAGNVQLLGILRKLFEHFWSFHPLIKRLPAKKSRLDFFMGSLDFFSRNSLFEP
ncbi:MAG: hypothetical protein K5896_06590 [Prevotella sp.]|nr:hypothetical protein [Prevotella sp.]